MDEVDKPNPGQPDSPPAPTAKEPEPIDAAPAAPATAQQLTQAEKQMSSFERATLHWAIAAVIVSGLAAFFVCLQWREMCSSSKDTRDVAAAAGSVAKTNAEELELTQRPWLTAEIISAGPFTFNPINKVHAIEFVVKVRNVGNSPAQMGFDTNVLNRWGLQGQEIAEQKAYCNTSRFRQSVLLFPHDEWVQAYSGTISDDEFRRSQSFAPQLQGRIMPKVIGCVNYSSTFSPTQHHTVFGYYIQNRKDTYLDSSFEKYVSVSREDVSFQRINDVSDAN